MPKPVVICIGTKNIVGDSLGPTVGNILITKYCVDAYVYGHLGRPINGLNYSNYIEHIRTHHKNSVIIAIDACLGKSKDVGRIKCSLKGIKAGGAFGKSYKRIGDIGILGVVAEIKQNKNNLDILKNVKKEVVHKLANSICIIVNKLISDINKNQPIEKTEVV